jgi:antitoxin component YwqK of YwqJK toxin-antitoxin module
MDMTKKDGGVIEQWDFNTLSYTAEDVKEKVGIEIKTDNAMILSGYIKEDPTGRFEVGNHFRSSLIIEIDEENGIVETKHTIYRLHGPAGEGIGDLGNLILKVFY